MARRFPRPEDKRDDGGPLIEERQILNELHAIAPRDFPRARTLLENAPSPLTAEVLRTLNAYWDALVRLDEECVKLERAGADSGDGSHGPV